MPMAPSFLPFIFKMCEVCNLSLLDFQFRSGLILYAFLGMVALHPSLNSNLHATTLAQDLKYFGPELFYRTPRQHVDF